MARLAASTIVGKAVGPIGYGLMGLTRPWAPTDYAVAAKVMKTALEQGANFWNGVLGLHYGLPHANSLQLLKYYFEQHPEDADKVVLSIKGAYNVATHAPDGTPEGIRASVDEALRILDGVKKIDIFECARVDPNVPVETSIAALAQLVNEAKIGGIGLSEASAATIRRAHAVYPLAAVEIELSLFSTDPIENGIVDTCQELNIPIIAYSPLSRGWLTGQFRKYDDLPEKDTRRFLPRFQPEVFDNNFKLVAAVEDIAKRKNATVGQIAIGWVRAQGAIPIPGATTVERVSENYKDVTLTAAELEEIRQILETLEVQGERYGGQHEKLLNL